MEKFKIRLFNGPDPQSQYDRLAVKDNHTLYILDLDGENAKAYLGLKPLAGGFGGEAGSVIGQHIETIFEANDSIEGYNSTTFPSMPFVTIKSGDNAQPLPLSKSLDNFDTIVIKTYYNDGDASSPAVINLSAKVDDLLKGRTIRAYNDFFSADGSANFISIRYDVELNQVKIVSDFNVAVVGIDGVKYQDAKVGRKLYKIFDRLEEDAANGATEEAGYIPESVNDPHPEDQELWSFMQMPSIENYDSIMIFLGIKDKANFFYPVHYELPVEHIKENYKKVVCNPSINYGDVLLGWIDATTIGINGITTGLIARIDKIYGIKYETVTKDPLTEATLRELITDVMGKELEKYVEYTIDDGTSVSEPEETETA